MAPLHDLIAAVYAHPAFDLPADAAMTARVLDLAQQLTDMAFARDHKSVGTGDRGRGQVQEVKAGTVDGAHRLYYTVLKGSVVLLRWGAKKTQPRDLAAAKAHCSDVHQDPARFLVSARRLA